MELISDFWRSERYGSYAKVEKSKASHSISNTMQPHDNIHQLLDDRVAFRLRAAEHHLNNLKEIESLHGGIARDHDRLEVEMEIDCFLSQIIGAVDSLLFQINSAFELGIPHNRVTFNEVQSGLSSKTKQISLLNELDKVRQIGNWYSVLSDIRNQSRHMTFLKKVDSAQDSFPSKPAQMRLMKSQSDMEGNPSEYVMAEEVIPYLDKSLHQVSSMIDTIRKKSSLLEPQE
jgi:hypothetical protein